MLNNFNTFFLNYRSSKIIFTLLIIIITLLIIIYKFNNYIFLEYLFFIFILHNMYNGIRHLNIFYTTIIFIIDILLLLFLIILTLLFQFTNLKKYIKNT